MKLSDSVSNYTGGCVCIHWQGGMGVELYLQFMNLMIRKTQSKIDGIMAFIMVLDPCIRHQINNGSVYDERGILSF